jgi:hypothetical protein
MPDTPEYPDRGYDTKDVEAMRAEPPRHGFLRRHWRKLTIAALIVLPALIFTIWSGIALGYTYSSGERVGYVQKLSKKGWLCKTNEGELAMVNVPGSLSEKFYFTVRDDSLARVINAADGKRVALTYEQHVGLPTSCFGETEYFVSGVRVVE